MEITKFFTILALFLTIAFFCIHGVFAANDITLHEAFLNISDICLNQQVDIEIFPKNYSGGFSEIDELEVASLALNATFGDTILIQQKEEYIKKAMFSEVGVDVVVACLSQNEKTICLNKTVEIKKCGKLDVTNKADIFESFIKHNYFVLSILAFFCLAIAILLIAIHISKS